MTTLSIDEAALYGPVLEAPFADAPRLVYADWLEEHGRALRAEFIRVQCEFSRLAGHHHVGGVGARRCQRCARSKYLATRAGRILGATADDGTSNWVAWKSAHLGMIIRYDRGFAGAVACQARTWQEQGPALVQALPVTELRLIDRKPNQEAGLGWAWFVFLNERAWAGDDHFGWTPYWLPPAWRPTLLAAGCGGEFTPAYVPAWNLPSRLTRGGRWLRPAKPADGTRALYPTIDAAARAVGRAALNWARGRAEPPLPPLDWPAAQAVTA